MPMYQVPAAVLPAMAYALSLYKDGIPSRFQKVGSYMKDFTEANPSTLHSTPVTIGHSGTVKPVDIFNGTQLRQLHTMVHQSPSKESLLHVFDFKDGFPESSDIKPLVLIPVDTSCQECGGNLQTDSRPSFITLYTVNGSKKGSSYHKRCSTCKITYNHSFTVKDVITTYSHCSLTQEILLTSSVTGFEMLYLRTISDLIDVAAITFTSASHAYKVTHSVPLERQRLEDAYFIRKLLQQNSARCEDGTLCLHRNPISNRFDIEAACEKVMGAFLFDENPYIKHACDTKGCREGFAMADGIEKIHRRICLAPKDTIRLTKSMPNTVACCPASPDLAAGSKYCQQHKSLNDAEAPSAEKKKRIVVTINIIGMTVSSQVLPCVSDIPDDSGEEVGCKEKSKVTRFYARTAGVMAIVRPCGVIIDHREMLSHESSSQLFTQLLRLSCDSEVNLKYLGYDRACDFEPFLKNLAKKGNSGAAQLLTKMQFLVDRFHIKGHTTPKCDINNDVCEYHPDLAKFSEISAANTECAEQAFSWLGRFKHTMKYMTHYRFKFFLDTIIEARNSRIVLKL